MKLEYINEQQTTIKATLDEGESLGHLTGPITAFVPVDPANTDYAAIQALDPLPEITPYTPPKGGPT